MNTKNQVQSLSALFVLWLVLAGLGIFQENLLALKFPLAKFVIFCGAILFLAISVRGRKKFWAPFFALILIIFNPFYAIINFSLNDLRISYFVVAAISAGFVWGYYSTYRKGAMFENFVADMFPDGIWTIVDRTKDYSKKLRRKVESDQNPDFVFRHNTTGNKVAVECKYRSYFYLGGIEILKSQLKRYAEYSQKENIPVYVFIGVGNSPKNPGSVFMIPLDKLAGLFGAQSEIVSQSVLKPFGISPKKEFTKGELA